MFKFIFERNSEPTEPEWDHDPARVPPFETLTEDGSLLPAMESTWDWLLGNKVPQASPEDEVAVEALAVAMATPAELPGSEPARVGAGYRLGRLAWGGSREALAALLSACGSAAEAERACRHARTRRGRRRGGRAPDPHSGAGDGELPDR